MRDSHNPWLIHNGFDRTKIFCFCTIFIFTDLIAIKKTQKKKKKTAAVSQGNF